MEEKILIESSNPYINSLKKICIVLGIASIVFWVISSCCRNRIDPEHAEAYKLFENYYEYGDTSIYEYLAPYLEFASDASEVDPSDVDDYANYFGYKNYGNIKGVCIVVAIVLAVADVILWIYYLVFYGVKIVVTNKRVYGRTSFGRQVDLPLDSISSVGIGLLNSIAVGTSSGQIKFWGVNNRDAIYEIIRGILADRQSNDSQKSQTSQTSNATQHTYSEAEELKKFKELLDADIITKEEFDAKKKQILGL